MLLVVKINYGEIMKERVVTAVQICHHRIKDMPHLVRLRVSSEASPSSFSGPLKAPRGLLTALAISAAAWVGVIAIVVL